MKSRLVSQDLRDYSLQLCVDNTRFTLKKEKKIKIVQNKTFKINKILKVKISKMCQKKKNQ
jgi:hypothetical protein